jgi:GH25 family lysozyme M1 (1,4-beta-N-acetylmuramidase)
MLSRWRLGCLLVVVAMLAVPAPAQGLTNGNLPGSALSAIASGVNCDAPAGELANGAAAGYNTMALAAHKPLPVNGCDSAYRSYSRQVYWRNYWCGQGNCANAAIPGTSNHGLGLAVDVPQWVRSYIDSTHGSFGFSKPCSDAPQEWWHVKFCTGFHHPDPGTHLQRPVLRVGSGGPGQAPWVKKAQKLLDKHGAHIHADGDFGQHTKDAVKTFQRAEHLPTDGVVGKRTWRHLREPVVQPKPPPQPHTKPHHRGAVYGVDVSEHQGSITWHKVREDGHKAFAIVKATEGEDYLDPTFDRARIAAIKDAHLVPAAYHFLRPRADRHGSKEARFFIQAITHAGYGRGWMIPWVDAEVTTLSPADTCRYTLSFLRLERKKLHVRGGVYTTPSFAATNYASCAGIDNYPLWVANIGVSRPAAAPPWHRHVIWQYSWTGKVPGIAGDVDVDKLPGGYRALRALQVSPPKKLERKPKAKVPAVRAHVADDPPALAQKLTPARPKPLPDGDTVRGR